MTTIATDGKTMAGDGLISSQGGTVAIGSRYPKVRLLENGEVAGVAGSPANAARFFDWANGTREDGFYCNSGDFAALILRPGGVFAMEGNGYLCEVDPPFAIGSGAHFAIGAMDAGTSPTEAVRIAAMRDNQTGGEIITIRGDAQKAPLSPPNSAGG